MSNPFLQRGYWVAGRPVLTDDQRSKLRLSLRTSIQTPSTLCLLGAIAFLLCCSAVGDALSVKSLRISEQALVQQSTARPEQRANAITLGAEAVLRSDGKVVAFANNSSSIGAGPVFISGLSDIVDIAGLSNGLGPLRRRGSDYWLALRRDGSVFQWSGECALDGYMDCAYSSATSVHGLPRVVGIGSRDGTHLAIDKEGRAWGGDGTRTG
jgi:hypothetical protein